MRFILGVLVVYLLLALVALVEVGRIAVPVGNVTLPPGTLDSLSGYLADVVTGQTSPLLLVVLFVALAPPAAFLYVRVQNWLDPTAHTWQMLERQSRQHAWSQGRDDEGTIRRALELRPPDRRATPAPDRPLSLAPGIPLAYLRGKPLGLPWDADRGHVAVIGPTRAGKSFHLTDTLLRWPGPALVIDPKGEQWQRTAGYRQEHCGPVYRFPPQGLDLAQLYDLGDDIDRRELHEVLLRPWRDGHDRIFADKALSIVEAAVVAGDKTGEHPLRILAAWARQSPTLALREAALLAPDPTRTFTDGTKPEEIDRNRFAMSAWGTFSTRFSPFAAQLATVTTPAIPTTWASANATIYLCYPLQAQAAVAPLAAALVGGLIRQLLARPSAARVLVAIDEMPTVALPHLSGYLATVGGAGITMLLYAQAIPQIEAVYGREEALSILANCPHQVFFPPREPQTAELVSRAYGTKYEIAQLASGTGVHFQTQYRPALEVGHLLALTAGQVVVFSQEFRFIADDNRRTVSGCLGKLSPPPTVQPPTPATSARPISADPMVSGDSAPEGEGESPSEKRARNEHRNRPSRREEPSERPPDDDPRERYW